MAYNTFNEKQDDGVKYDEKHAQKNGNRTASLSVKKALIISGISLFSFLTLKQWVSRPPPLHEPIFHTQTLPGESGNPIFSWFDITPSPELVYHECYDGFECARLEVPLDYHRKDGKGKKVAVAVTRLPAKVPVTDIRYGGPIVTNPGGPGGSGVMQVLRGGRATQLIVDSPYPPNDTVGDASHKYFDIVSFDPRGIGRTTPGIQCFPDSLQRMTWEMQSAALGLLGSSEDSFQRNWYRSQALAKGCSVSTGTTDDGSEAVGEHVNTSPVVRDMLEIVERHAEWVASVIEQASDVGNEGLSAKRTKYRRGEVKLSYWGNSYGTIIGQTFAAMYPDRVGRIIADGVVAADSFYNGPWMSNLVDSDKILDRFFEYCDAAGVSGCSFYTTGGPKAIEAAYDALLVDIFHNPLPVVSSSTRGPDVITWSDVKSTVRYGVYQPLIFMSMVADLLTDVSSGNGSLFADFKHMDYKPVCPTEECKTAGPFSPECNAVGDNGVDASLAILCTDAQGLGDTNESQFQEYWHALQQQSKVLGDWWAHTRLGCVGWQTKAKWRFTGPFSGPTAHPILFIGNTLDPVTPFVNAQQAADSFDGSVVLRQDSEGHTSWASPSVCTAKVARLYFQTGQVPEKGTVCPVDMKPLLGRMPHVEELSEHDQDLLRALVVLGEEFSETVLRSSRSSLA